MNSNQITESEKITMKCVWDLGNGARLAQILELADTKYGRDWKPQTVSTFLGKLVRKGFLEQYRDGRYFYYRIIVKKEDYRCRLIRDEINFWEDGDISLFAGELLNQKTFTEEERKIFVEALKKADRDEKDL